MADQKSERRVRRRKRVRAKIYGTGEIPRLSVFRSNRYIYGQVVDDQTRKTLVTASDMDLKKRVGSKSERAKMIGTLIGERAIKKGIKKVVFDRKGYKYHGRVKALAQGARDKGLIF